MANRGGKSNSALSERLWRVSEVHTNLEIYELSQTLTFALFWENHRDLCCFFVFMCSKALSMTGTVEISLTIPLTYYYAAIYELRTHIHYVHGNADANAASLEQL